MINEHRDCFQQPGFAFNERAKLRDKNLHFPFSFHFVSSVTLRDLTVTRSNDTSAAQRERDKIIIYYTRIKI